MSAKVKSNVKSNVSKTQHGDLAGTRLPASARRGSTTSKSKPDKVPRVPLVNTKKAVGRPSTKSKDRVRTYAEVLKEGKRESDLLDPLSDDFTEFPPDVPTPSTSWEKESVHNAGEMGDKTPVEDPVVVDTEEELIVEEEALRTSALAAAELLSQTKADAKLKRAPRALKRKARKVDAKDFSEEPFEDIETTGGNTVDVTTDQRVEHHSATPRKVTRRRKSHMDDRDLSSAYGSTERKHPSSGHFEDTRVHQESELIYNPAEGKYIPTNQFDAEPTDYQGPWVHHPTRLERECILKCCEEKCGHVLCSRSVVWRGNPRSQSLWSNSVVPEWWSYQQRDIVHLSEHINSWYMVGNEL